MSITRVDCAVLLIQSAERHAILWRDPPTTETRLPRVSNLACIAGTPDSPTKIVAVSFCSCRFAGVHCTKGSFTQYYMFELTAKSAVIIFMFVVCRSAYPIFLQTSKRNSQATLDRFDM